MYSANKIKKKRPVCISILYFSAFLKMWLLLKKYHIRKQTIKEGEVILNFNISNEQTCKKCEKDQLFLIKLKQQAITNNEFEPNFKQWTHGNKHTLCCHAIAPQVNVTVMKKVIKYIQVLHKNILNILSQVCHCHFLDLFILVLPCSFTTFIFA